MATAIEGAQAKSRIAEPAARAPGQLDFAFAHRVRVESLIAGTRVVLGLGGLLATIVDPLPQPVHTFLLYLLACYLTYSLAILALVWAPARFAPGWGLAVYLFDFVAFIFLVVATRDAASPFFVCFLFLLVCGTLRWHVKGTIGTAAAVFAAYTVISLYTANVLFISGFDLNTLVIRSVYIVVITAMMTVIGAHHHRFQREIGQIAGWPRHVASDPRAAVSEILSQVQALLNAPLVLLAWDEVGEDSLTLSWLRDGQTKWAESTRSEYHPLVLASLNGKSFQASDASDDQGIVIVHSSRGFRRRDGRPLNEALRARFQIKAVQSWPIEGELVRGRLFAANRIKMGIDDLVVGELVASQIASRLDSTLMLGRLRDAATLEERVRVAGNLHDTLLQAQAGAALQLLAARRLLDRRPEAARQRLEEVQNLLERGELEMRSFIRDLRPGTSRRPSSTPLDLAGRLERLRLRVERQWPLTVTLHLNGSGDRIPEALREDVYHLVHEGITNAARHADASVVIVDLSVTASSIRIEVADDGRGFSFHGTFDLQTLNKMKIGPLTLKERVGRLAGDLTISSVDTGTVVIMTVPLTADSD